jgi:hypothetical protein
MQYAIWPIGALAMTVAIVGLFVWSGVQNRREANETVRRAIEAGHPLDAKTVDALVTGWGPGRDLRRAIVYLSLAVGFGLSGYLMSTYPFAGEHHHRFGGGMGFYIPAIIFGAVGVGRLLVAFLAPRRDRTDG